MFDEIKITDVIEAASAAIAATTGVIMAILAYKEYLKAPVQEEAMQETLESEAAPQAAPSEITIFKTSKQTTKLRAVDNHLVCEIVDTRPGKGGIQWKFHKDLCRKIIDQKQVSANPNYKPRTGLITIGPRSNWLYSKALYWDHTVLENDIYALLGETA
ncbi:MAG: hypothetical protein AAGH89_06005 [Verrucomicrobiota bacterium]